MSKVLHIVSGTNDVANGMVVVARLLAKEQGDAEVVDLNHGMERIQGSDVEEVWMHGMWLPREWAACRMALRAGKRLVRMPHGSLSPVYLQRQGKWKKRLVGPIERFFLRKADVVVATCNAEAEWIRKYEPRVRKIGVTDMKRFFDFSRVKGERGLEFGGGEKLERELHILYLGRKHPLKGVWQLEKAVEGIGGVELRIVSNASGEEKEKAWDWCDVLVLPSLSENFGLVIAEALERGKRVVTTDGAPAWSSSASATEDGGGGNDYGGRLIYLNGYRDGSDEKRVELLKKAIERICT